MEPLSYEETVETAMQLLREGRNPTASAVVRRVGRGSKSTALKHIQRWRESLDATGFVMPAGVPDALVDPMEAIWNAALQAASQVFDQERERTQQQQEASEGRAAVAEALAQDAQSEARRLENELEQLQQRTEDLDEARKAASHALENARKEIQDLRESHEAEREKWEARLQESVEREQDRAKQETQALQERIDELKGQIEAWESRYDDTERYWLQEVANARHSTEKAIEARSADRAEFDRERRMLNEQITQRGVQITKLENTVTRLEAEAEQAKDAQRRVKSLEAERDSLQAEVEKGRIAQQRAAELTDDVKRLQGWVDRLTDQRTRVDGEQGEGR
ncbi:hypothetical protein TK90_2778 (plasmid) [Thioalkalivibrio sp. K90mix]|uniref:DNA-binding protein n=1 Tax=Thioalkalivibrio sp. (strain K90mix) TaxID=396595 RepID=UPI000195A68D|nr:DNA-binding protein [Thioalkalivibrio sp. K90mix]ADC73263.1 hypothetical protein TK90_2778 [Thioalkalivibrio sp. K90mix]